MPICAVRTEKVGVPTRPDKPRAVRPNSYKEAENGTLVREFGSARVGTPRTSKIRLMSSTKRRAAWSTLYTSPSGCA